MSIVSEIFCTPIFQYDNINIRKEELNIVENEVERFKNVGNSTSLDNYILDKKEFKKLKNVLTSKINNYFQEVYAPLNKDLKLYITQSWLNYTTENEFHHAHHHNNSLVSGVFYFKADKDDHICFEKDKSIAFDIPSDQTNNFNARVWGVSVEPNMLVVFPSTVIHSVQQKRNNNLRISLAFNTFIKGTIGSKQNLTELKL